MSSNLRRIVTLAIGAIAVAAVVAAIAQLSRDRAYAIGRSSPPAVDANGASSAARPCSVATIAGDWAFLTRTKTSGGVDGTGTGIFHLDKDGSSSFHGWFNVGGVFLEQSATGTTSVDADCTGTQAWDGGGPIAKIVVLRNGREIWAVYDGPDVTTVTLERINGPL